MMRRTANIVVATASALLIGGGVVMMSLHPTAAPRAELQQGLARVQGQIVVEKLEGAKVVDADTVNRTLVAPGIRHLIALMKGDSTSCFDTAAYIAVGKDSTATDTTMTSLQATTKYWGNVDSVTSGGCWVKYWRSFLSAAANDTWREIGLFNDSAKIMLDRGVYTSWGLKTTADTWRASVKLTFE